MKSAVDTLRKLKGELDKALAEFVRSYAAGVASDLGERVNLPDVLAHVDEHSLGITISPDHQEVVSELRVLLTDVVAGIEAAENLGEYDVVKALSDQAASSCLSAAEKTRGEEQLLLNGVAPYWRMRSAYAEHQNRSSLKNA